MSEARAAEAVAWHDAECGAYTADLALWRELADAADGPVVDAGAGTGRVSIDLAERGHEVVAVELEQALLDALRERARAADLTIVTHTGDARRGVGVTPGSAALLLAPMQFLQILGGRRGRAAFLRATATALCPGGLLVAAIAGGLETFRSGDGPLPRPDVLERDGARYVSQPVAVLVESCVTKIERVRRIERDGAPAQSYRDVIELDHLTPRALVREAAELGFVSESARAIAATDAHVGSVAVLLRRADVEARAGGVDNATDAPLRSLPPRQQRRRAPGQER